MTKKKVTLYLDESVVKAAKVTAIATSLSESALVEQAIISYLGTKDIKGAKADLLNLLEEVAKTSKVSETPEDEIMDIAVKETKSIRKNRQISLLPKASNN
ncbi:MAG: hypothetical protein HKL80_00190 [Acidimicrobiales bacterium]|nr:hypothetical protein [Acidimicrobiales bacterium]